jgi:subtilisin family serine protease
MKYKKLAAGMLTSLEIEETEQPEAIKPTASLLGLTEPDTIKPTRAIVFLHCSPKAAFPFDPSEGIHVNASSGAIRTALVPLEKIEELAENDDVWRIVPSRQLRPRMDVAAHRVRLANFKNSTKRTGQGVIIGIVDTGIDPNHADLKDRILRIWDQTRRGAGVAEGDYGLELSGDQLKDSRDTDGHGTHVAGIAGGSGAVYAGVAPQAELVVVKTDFNDAHIANGIQYVFRIAKELGRPAVVNLSMGGHSDAHDGTDSLSKLIDQECGEGRIVCCSAGNEGTDNIHARLSLGKPATRTVNFRVPKSATKTCQLNGWYPGIGELEISVRTPDNVATPFQGVIAAGKALRRYELSGTRIIIESPGPDPLNGDHNFLITLRSTTSGNNVRGGTWQLRVRNTSRVLGHLDVWTLDDQDAPVVLLTGKAVNDAIKIGSPGTSQSAITVGAYTTRATWSSASNDELESGLVAETMADFSSEGPLRNGDEKPDLAAPGAMVVSCLSANATIDQEFHIDALHYVEGGTSMASPFIAGIVALLLEKKPKLTPPQVKSLLKSACRIPRKAVGKFSPVWGFGLIDCDKLVIP